MTWLVYILAIKPELQSWLHNKIHEHILQDPFEDLNHDIGALLESLPLLNSICNETLHLYPTVPLSIQTLNKDTTIVRHVVPKGTELYMIPWVINCSHDLWGPTAHKFMLERWIDAHTGKPNNTGGAGSNYTVMTFLQGVHMCIGQAFSKAELCALVVTLVHAFEIELTYPDKPVTLVGIITTKPEGGLWIKLKRV